MKTKTFLTLSFIVLFVLTADGVKAQKREHLIGVRSGYSISGMFTTPTVKISSINSYQNWGLVYTYYHDLWGYINFFGFQTGISKIDAGHISNEGTVKYQLIKLPLVSQFHFDFWRMRLLLNAGCFGGYRINKESEEGVGFDTVDYRIDYGFIGGGGLAFKLKPFELHIEANYSHSLSHMHSPKKYSEDNYLFTYPYTLLFSLTLYLNL